jgi:putative polyketide hydroxylase
VIGDGTTPPPYDPAAYTPTATPGHRAPHLWVNRDGRQISTLDPWDGRWALLGGPDADAWVDAADALSIEAARFGHELEGDVNAFLELFGIQATGAVLVRPDGHVAWRHPTAAEEPRSVLQSAITTALHPTLSRSTE